MYPALTSDNKPLTIAPIPKVMEPEEDGSNLPTDQIYKDVLGLLRQLHLYQNDPEIVDQYQGRIDRKIAVLKPRLVTSLKEKLQENPDFGAQIQQKIKEQGHDQLMALKQATGQELVISDIFNDMAIMFQQADMKQDLMLFMQMHTIKELQDIKETQQQLLQEQQKTNQLLGQLMGNMKQIDTSTKSLTQIEKKLALKAGVNTSPSFARRWFGFVMTPYENYVQTPLSYLTTGVQTYQNVNTALKVAQAVASVGWIIALL